MLDYTDIMMRIDSIKRSAYNGEMPTWYAYQEINRLENLLNQLKDKR